MSDPPRTARFGLPALEAGQLAICIYRASDSDDASKLYNDKFGNYDWEDLRRRGWSASRAVDWLTTLDLVDSKKIYIGGHSRSAKSSLVAAAFDDRFAGVIASSPGGGGGSMNFVLSDQYYFYASAEGLTRNFPTWRTPRLRFFTGRENQLPADNHMLYALVAPRPLMMSTALHDSVENTWAIEKFFEEIRKVYDLLGTPGNIGLRYRPGPHAPDEGTYTAHNEFLLRAIAQQSIAEAFPCRPYHVWNYDEWVKKFPPGPTPEKASAKADRTQIVERIKWLLGEAPPARVPRHEIKPSTRPEVPMKVVFDNGLVVGYAMGGMVAAYTMALDDRPAGGTIVGGFTPFRSDTDARGTGGGRRWSHHYGWLPRLGAFVGREQEIPIDFDQILAAAAPKPMLVIAPKRDWHATYADVETAKFRDAAGKEHLVEARLFIDGSYEGDLLAAAQVPYGSASSRATNMVIPPHLSTAAANCRPTTSVSS